MTCKICNGYGQVHPVIDGKIMYDRTVYCKCQDKAGQVASREKTEAELNLIIKSSYSEIYDYLHNMTGDAIREQEPVPEPIQPDYTSLDRVKGEVTYLNNKLNNHLDAGKKKPVKKPREYKGLNIERAED